MPTSTATKHAATLSPPVEQLAQLLTPSLLAREINCTPQTILNWHRAGVIPARIAVGRIIRFDRAEVMEALAYRSHKQEAAR